MYIYVYIYTYIYIYIHTYIYICIYTYIYIYIYKYVISQLKLCGWVSKYGIQKLKVTSIFSAKVKVWVYGFIDVYIHSNVYVCMYVWMYIDIYITIIDIKSTWKCLLYHLLYVHICIYKYAHIFIDILMHV
jgi:hypothetical protein